MRILHILDHSIPLHSGYTFRTAAILREQRALGWETFHLTSPKQIDCKVEEEDVDGWHFYRTTAPTGGASNWPVVGELLLMKRLEARLLDVARQVKPDILHAHSPVLNALPAIKVARRLGIPVVYEIRAFWEDAAVDHGTTSEGSLRYRATRALETWAIKRVDHVFTICEGLRRDILARGIAESKVTVIPNAVDVEGFQLSGTPDDALKARLGLAGRTVLGFVGSFYAYEGLDLLLDAFAAMHAGQPDLRVLLVGGGPQDANLKAQAQRLGVADKVVFTGRLDRDQMAALYRDADLTLNPSRVDNMPVSVLEAMACGVPVVTTDVGGIPFLVSHERTALLVPADAPQAMADSQTSMPRLAVCHTASGITWCGTPFISFSCAARPSSPISACPLSWLCTINVAPCPPAAA